MWPCWAAFAVHSLEIARSAAKPLSCGPRTKASFLVCAPVRWSRRIVALGGIGVHLGPAMLESALSFFSQLVDKAGVCASHPATVGQKQGIRGDLYRWPARIEALL